MSASVTRPRAVHRAPRPHHRRWLMVVAAVTALILVAVVGILKWSARDDSRALAESATVTASSTAGGTSPADVVKSDAGRPPGPGWRSAGETTGAWLELSWPEPHVLHQILIARNPVAGPGATAGFLSFGDGSYLQVRLSTTDPTTVVPITPREVDSVRFTVSAVSPGAQDVTVNRFLVRDTAGADDVATDGAPQGNAAAAATVTQSPNLGAADGHALQDGSGAPGGRDTGADWTAEQTGGGWVQLNWDQPRELASVELVGSTRSAAKLAAATLAFDDGSTVPVGAVLPEPDRSTVVAFMPHVTRSVRLTLDRVDGRTTLALAELRAYQPGATPPRPGAPPPAATPPVGAPCVDTPASDAVPVVVRCPSTGSTVDGRVALQVATAPGYSGVSATVWPADPAAATGETVRGTPDPSGLATLTVDATAAPPGPFTIDVEATGDGRQPAHVYYQLYRGGDDRAGDVPSSPAAAGRTLVRAEEFDGPVSASRTGAGADYASAKPEHDGAEDFGAAVFTDPAQGADTPRVVDDRYLRIDVAPTPPGYTDPQGYGRTHFGGLLASARSGGSGFSAQYGYFEARMLAPAAPGTWPAFWTLPSDNLVRPTPAVAEIDAVELYGHDPKGGCQSTHGYQDGKDGGVARCGQRHPTERAALAWHTYGVSILPDGNTFYIDGHVVATAPQVVGSAAPMFFLVDLALGGGWPIQLQGVQDRAQLYVDYIRVYV